MAGLPTNRHGLILAAVAIATISASALAAEGPKPDDLAESFQKVVRPFVQKHCFECHSGPDAESGVKLDAYTAAEQVSKDGKTWQRVFRALRGGKMPPADGPRPPQADTAAVLAWIEKALAADCGRAPDPGRVTMRRLNRVEYQNTVRDLLGVEFRATEDFPADDLGYGFDTIGDVLSLPPLLMERYLDAAERIAAKTIVADVKGRKLEDLPDPHRRVLFVRPSDKLSPGDASRQIFERLAARAYRRPARPEEVDRLVRLAEDARKQGESFESSIRLGLTAILVSPHFLFKVEPDPEPGAPGNVRTLGEHELAVRLSYFLWSTMPDERLFDLAARGQLRKDLDAEVGRMLADPKSQALVENFAGQWLEIRNLDRAAPDRRQFRDFDDRLREAMRRESLLVFAGVVREDRSVIDLLDADYTYLNERLARHYGIPGVSGEEFRRVSVAGTPRGGLLTQAAMLTLTSNPQRTSPVKRGKWVLENVLGEPPPPPPPGVPQLAEGRRAALAGSLRQRMEEHRKDPTCAVCHQKMDALGFALENFDPVGAWRTKDGSFDIDPSGVLPDGRAFKGPAELKKILAAADRDAFARCLTEKMLTYALGRGVEYFDRCAVDKIVAEMKQNNYRFSVLVREIARSEPFQKRRGTE